MRPLAPVGLIWVPNAYIGRNLQLAAAPPTLARVRRRPVRRDTPRLYPLEQDREWSHFMPAPDGAHYYHHNHYHHHVTQSFRLRHWSAMTVAQAGTAGHGVRWPVNIQCDRHLMLSLHLRMTCTDTVGLRFISVTSSSTCLTSSLPMSAPTRDFWSTHQCWILLRAHCLVALCDGSYRPHNGLSRERDVETVVEVNDKRRRGLQVATSVSTTPSHGSTLGSFMVSSITEAERRFDRHLCRRIFYSSQFIGDASVYVCVDTQER